MHDCFPRREAHTERIYQQSPYEGSGNLNIHCWHCADLADGQSGPAAPGAKTFPHSYLTVRNYLENNNHTKNLTF